MKGIYIFSIQPVSLPIQTHALPDSHNRVPLSGDDNNSGHRGTMKTKPFFQKKTGEEKQVGILTLSQSNP